MNKKIRLTEKFSEFMILLVIFVSMLILTVLGYSLANDKNVDGLSSGLVILVANSITVSMLLFIKIKEMEMRWFNEIPKNTNSMEKE